MTDPKQNPATEPANPSEPISAGEVKRAETAAERSYADARHNRGELEAAKKAGRKAARDAIDDDYAAIGRREAGRPE